MDDLKSPPHHELPGSTSLPQQNDHRQRYVVGINCLFLNTASLTFKTRLNNPSCTCTQISLFTVFLSGTNSFWITLRLYKKLNDNFGLHFSKQNFLHIIDDYARLFSTKDATGKVWIGLTDLYKVFTCCDSVLLLLNCTIIRNKPETHLPLSQICRKNLMNPFPVNGLLILHQF